MRELIQIIDAFKTIVSSGGVAALATVVAVDGPSYRRPGARMLVAPDGRTWGGVSGGCLERDVARRARGVLDTGIPIVCRYETGGDEDLLDPSSRARIGDPGAALGCGGAIEILIERVMAGQPGPLEAIARVIRDHRPEAIVTVYRVGGKLPARVGDRMFSCEKATTTDEAVASILQDDLLDAAKFDRPGEARRHVLPGGWVDVLVECLRPPQMLVVFGDGPDVAPLVEMAQVLGWQVTVAGLRPAHILRQQFPTVRGVFSVSPDDPAADVVIPPDSATVVMMHDLRRDAAILQRLALHPPAYVGVLGPRRRTERLLSTIPSLAEVTPSWLHAPVGLDIGGDTPETIALSIVSEIQGMFARRQGGPLRDRDGPIHDPVSRSANEVVV